MSKHWVGVSTWPWSHTVSHSHSTKQATFTWIFICPPRLDPGGRALSQSTTHVAAAFTFQATVCTPFTSTTFLRLACLVFYVLWVGGVVAQARRNWRRATEASCQYTVKMTCVTRKPTHGRTRDTTRVIIPKFGNHAPGDRSRLHSCRESPEILHAACAWRAWCWREVRTSNLGLSTLDSRATKRGSSRKFLLLPLLPLPRAYLQNQPRSLQALLHLLVLFLRLLSDAGHNQLGFHMTFRLLLIAHAILIRTLPYLFVKIHLRFFGRRHQEIQLSSTVPWVARTEVLLVVTWAVLLICWEPLHHQLLEMLPLKHIWRICSNTEIVSYSAINLSVPRGFCTSCALQEYNGDLLSYFFLQESPPIHQQHFLGQLQFTILIENHLSNEFFVL